MGIPRYSGAVVSGSIFILFVDDDAAFAHAAARSFESVGMRAVLALGSMAAVDVFDGDEIDVVVTDIKLPAREPQSSASKIGAPWRDAAAAVLLRLTHSNCAAELGDLQGLA